MKHGRRRSLGRRISLVGVVLVLAYGAVRLGFELWRHAVLPADAPRIVMSLDDTWLNDLGVMRGTYEQALARAGARLEGLAPDAAGTPVDRARVIALLAEADGLLLTGGGDVDPRFYGGDPDAALLVNRQRDELEIALIDEARTRGIPVLGICRGCQILNVALGGTLRAPDGSHFILPGDHAVELEADSRLARIHGVTQLPAVRSYHRQAVAKPGRSVRITARSNDGGVEGIEVDGDWAVAVQWHPELDVADAQQNALFRAFVDAARDHAQRR